MSQHSAPNPLKSAPVLTNTFQPRRLKWHHISGRRGDTVPVGLASTQGGPTGSDAIGRRGLSTRSEEVRETPAVVIQRYRRTTVPCLGWRSLGHGSGGPRTMGGSHVGSDIETCMGGSRIRRCPVLAPTHARASGRVTRLSKVVRTPAPAGVPYDPRSALKHSGVGHYPAGGTHSVLSEDDGCLYDGTPMVVVWAQGFNHHAECHGRLITRGRKHEYQSFGRAPAEV